MKPTNNFNSIASIYDALSFFVFGNTIKKSQRFYIEHIPKKSKVLILGDGTGYFLYHLLKQDTFEKIDCVDASEKMIALAKERIKTITHSSKINFIASKFEQVILSEEYDVVVANYFLDLFPEKKLASIISLINQHLKEPGILIVTDFKIKNENRNHLWQKALHQLMILFFKLTCNIENTKLVDFSMPLQTQYFTKIHSKEFYKGMIEAAVYKRKD